MPKPKKKQTKRKRLAARPKVRRAKRTPLNELNCWVRTNHDALMNEARQNCLRLTGRATFGGTSRRKSA